MVRLIVCYLSLVLAGAQAQAQTFDEYLADIRQQAISEGVAADTIDHAFAGLTEDERVIVFDRRQPEFVQTFDEYLAARVTDFRRREGRRLFVENSELLTEVADKYQIDPQYIIAFWGLETSFGRYQGKYSIIRSLATLGHDQRRSAFFSAELIKALVILDEGHISAKQFVGAWAGAMGQSQFMPSSFLNFAQDFDGDGRKDLWHSKPDVFASIANYLQQAGWKKERGWGARVNLPQADWALYKPENRDTRCRALKYHTKKMKPEKWEELGIRSQGLLADETYALILPAEGQTKSYLVGGNFRAILNYNCANKYAVSVGLLAEDLIAN